MCALVVKGQSILLRTWTWDQTTLWNLSAIKTEQNEVHAPTANDAEHLSALITFKISAKIINTPGILTPSDFHLYRSGGHVVPGENHPTLWLIVSLGENHPT